MFLLSSRLIPMLLIQLLYSSKNIIISKTGQRSYQKLKLGNVNVTFLFFILPAVFRLFTFVKGFFANHVK